MGERTPDAVLASAVEQGEAAIQGAWETPTALKVRSALAEWGTHVDAVGNLVYGNVPTETPVDEREDEEELPESPPAAAPAAAEKS